MTALAAALLVLLLVVFSGSPQLHAWLHSHDAAQVGGHQAGGHHGNAPPGATDDGCAITLFASGVIAVLAVVHVLATVLRLVDFIARADVGVCRGRFRYWLPPLCGPPLR